MKKEDLFPGAIVLSRISGSKKRSRREVIEVFSTSVKLKVNNKDNSFFFASLEHIRPAKITRKALKELGFKEEKTYCSLHRARISSDGKPYCLKYKYAGPENISVMLKGDCNFWNHNMIFGRYGTSEISYIHEMQKVINKINNQK